MQKGSGDGQRSGGGQRLDLAQAAGSGLCLT